LKPSKQTQDSLGSAKSANDSESGDEIGPAVVEVAHEL